MIVLVWGLKWSFKYDIHYTTTLRDICTMKNKVRYIRAFRKICFPVVIMTWMLTDCIYKSETGNYSNFHMTWEQHYCTAGELWWGPTVKTILTNLKLDNVTVWTRCTCYHVGKKTCIEPINWSLTLCSYCKIPHLTISVLCVHSAPMEEEHLVILGNWGNR